MFYPTYDFNTSETDIYLGNLDGVPFYMGAEQYEYWEHTQFIIDVVSSDSNMFALQNGIGKPLLRLACAFG